jgi:hypothetical protein
VFLFVLGFWVLSGHPAAAATIYPIADDCRAVEATTGELFELADRFHLSGQLNRYNFYTFSGYFDFIDANGTHHQDGNCIAFRYEDVNGGGTINYDKCWDVSQVPFTVFPSTITAYPVRVTFNAFTGAYAGACGGSGTGGQPWTNIYLGTIYFEQGNPHVDFSTSTGATIGIIASPEELCSGLVSTSTGWLDSVGSSIVHGMCVGGAFLFVPSPASINSVFSLKDSLFNKVPFGYLAAVSSTLEGISDATPTTTPISFVIERQDNLFVPTTTIDIFNPSTIPPILDGVFEKIRQLDTAIVGGLFLYWAYNKMRGFHP